MGKMPKFDLCHHNNYYNYQYMLDAPMLHRTQLVGVDLQCISYTIHIAINFYLLLHILSDVDIKIKATLIKCIIGKLHVCKSARLKKYKFVKVQN
jgi:hypothetical protein